MKPLSLFSIPILLLGFGALMLFSPNCKGAIGGKSRALRWHGRVRACCCVSASLEQAARRLRRFPRRGDSLCLAG